MFSSLIMVKKGILGFLTGLAAVVVLGIVQTLSSYNPIACSENVTENCTPAVIVLAYTSVVPIVTGALVAFANWLKNKNK